jgi:hypothetical protein
MWKIQYSSVRGADTACTLVPYSSRIVTVVLARGKVDSAATMMTLRPPTK